MFAFHASYSLIGRGGSLGYGLDTGKYSIQASMLNATWSKNEDALLLWNYCPNKDLPMYRENRRALASEASERIASALHARAARGLLNSASPSLQGTQRMIARGWEPLC